jgi:transposase
MSSSSANRLELSDDERRVLRRWIRHKSGLPAALRARIILACANGHTNAEVAQRLGVSRETVRKWRVRFQTCRLAGLADEPRPGAPRTISDERIRRVVAATLYLPAPGGGRWTTRSLATAIGVSQTAVSRIWREFGLRPDQVQAWRLVSDPEFVARVSGIAGMHLARRGSALALVMSRPAIRVPDSHAESTSRAVLPASDLAESAMQFLCFLGVVDAVIPSAALHVICADEPILAARPVRRWLARHRRFRCHATPACASWAVMADRWLITLSDAGRSVPEELRVRFRDWVKETGEGRGCGPIWCI